MHQEFLSANHVFGRTFSVNFKVVMPQRKEMRVTLMDINTVSDMKHATSCEDIRYMTQ